MLYSCHVFYYILLLSLAIILQFFLRFPNQIPSGKLTVCYVENHHFNR